MTLCNDAWFDTVLGNQTVLFVLNMYEYLHKVKRESLYIKDLYIALNDNYMQIGKLPREMSDH